MARPKETDPFFPHSNVDLTGEQSGQEKRRKISLMQSSPRMVSAPFWVERSCGVGGGVEAEPMGSGPLSWGSGGCGRNGAFL